MTRSRRFAGGRPSSRLALGIVRVCFRSRRKDVIYVKYIAFLERVAPPLSAAVVCQEALHPVRLPISSSYHWAL
jgi:hypothetical protein